MHLSNFVECDYIYCSEPAEVKVVRKHKGKVTDERLLCRKHYEVLKNDATLEALRVLLQIEEEVEELGGEQA